MGLDLFGHLLLVLKLMVMDWVYYKETSRIVSGEAFDLSEAVPRQERVFRLHHLFKLIILISEQTLYHIKNWLLSPRALREEGILDCW